MHPVLMMFGQQHNIVNWNYLEYLLLVPYIQWNENEAPKYKYRSILPPTVVENPSL